MCFSHGAPMVFDRVPRPASIPRLAWVVVLGLLLWLGSVTQGRAVSLLRDADIEHGLTQLAFPVLRAAGLRARSVRVLVVNDSAFNAFVIDHRTIFLNYGLIQKVKRADMLQAVIAHEAAHISNGHLARRMSNLKGARSAAGLGAILAVIAAAAGAGEAAAGIAAGTQSSAIRAFLAHTRAEESAADRSAANYLRYSGISLQGMVDLHQAFMGQELLTVSRQDPYNRSHPLSRDRIRAAQALVERFGTDAPPNPNADYWFARVRGKLSAFTRAPKWTRRRAGEETHPDIRHMRLAIAHHRDSNISAALSEMERALSIRPDDPYYYDLKGQILMENRRWGAALEAYETATALAPDEPLILGGLGRAQLAAGQLKAGLASLEKARSRDFRDIRVMYDLAIAYAKDGQTGMAALITSERFALQGNLQDAGLHARRAVAQLPRGSTAWQRAQDVLIASEKFQKGKKR